MVNKQINEWVKRQTFNENIMYLRSRGGGSVTVNAITTEEDLFVDLPEAFSAGAMMPYFIPSGTTFHVPLYKQGLYEMTIDVEGFLLVDGFTVEVD